MSPLPRAVSIALVLVVLTICARIAWVCDDAYITFRTIDHWQLGYGPVWNIQERVQTYTHPLWMLLLTGTSLLTGELYFTAIGLGLLGATATLVTLLRLEGAATTAPLLLVLGCSKAWTEFATSGLENALSYTVIAGAVVTMSPRILSRPRQVAAALLLGLAPLCRPDLALVVSLPAALLVWTSRGWWPVLAAGLGPGLVWVAFATVYYGTPLPNTALAKLGHAPISQNLTQGLAYLRSSIQLDPALLPVTGLGLGLALARSRKAPSMATFSLGGGLYLVYIVSIGGDFMSGRFLTVPFLLAVAILMSTGRRATWLVAPAALALSLTSTASPLRTTADFHVPNWDDAGIADERGWYYPHLGLVPILREGRDPPKPGRSKRPGEGRVRMGKAIGMDAYMSGPQIHLVDAYALCDPLLARIPSDEILGRPGHWIRPVPRGYLETLKTGQNLLADPEVAALWADVYLATRAPLWTPGRVQAIGRLLTYGRTAPIQGVPPMSRPPRTPPGDG
ncbi:MAG: hypothetical protein CL927_06815 [Deltaproteobacteria bacterium]|nr:hypothetical protein [Deltaproteobacteria bacterium]HCH63057.1 hypothetical protein [Deltaproteobacteria bacterium]